MERLFLGRHVFGDLFDPGDRPDITDDRYDLTGKARKAVGGGGEITLRARTDVDPGPVGGESLSDHRPNAPTASGDERHPAVE